MRPKLFDINKVGLVGNACRGTKLKTLLYLYIDKKEDLFIY